MAAATNAFFETPGSHCLPRSLRLVPEGVGEVSPPTETWSEGDVLFSGPEPPDANGSTDEDADDEDLSGVLG